MLRQFFELIKNIGECKSKQEEDKILGQEVSILKVRFTEQLSPKKMKEARAAKTPERLAGTLGEQLGFRRARDARKNSRILVFELDQCESSTTESRPMRELHSYNGNT